MKRINGKYSVLVFALLMFIFSGGTIFAQTITVRGTVTEKATGEPLPFVTVFVKGTTSGTSTLDDGTYTLSATPSATIVFSSIGYNTIEVVVGSRTVIDVALETDNVMLEEVVMVGFGSQRRAHLTGAVETVDTKALETRPIVDLNAGLQGLSPGLQILYNSGQLNESPTMRVRGSGTVVNGDISGSPLVLVDGIQTSLDMVNPNDVENISILKDAASASIYGARAAFGVILISTKRGDSNENLRYSYTGSMGWGNPTRTLKHMDVIPELEAIIATSTARNERSEVWGAYHDVTLPGVQKWLSTYKSQRNPNDREMVYGEDFETIGGQTYFYRVWDPVNMMLGSNIPTTNHSFNISGKLGNNSSLMASFGYNSREGVMAINPEKMKRYNAMVNVNTRFSKWLTGDIRVMMTRQDYQEPYNYMGGVNSGGMSGGNNNGYFGHIYRYGTYAPYGTYQGLEFGWAPGFLRMANYNERKTDYLRLGVNLKAEITKELSLVAEYSIAQQYMHNRINGGTFKTWNFQPGTIYVNDPGGRADTTPGYFYAPNSINDSVRDLKSSVETYVFNAYARYIKKVGQDHNFAAQVGINSDWNESERNFSAKTGIFDYTRPEYALAGGSEYSFTNAPTNNNQPSRSHASVFGIFGRLNYDYKGKYLLEMSGRVDGSSKFPSYSQWGFFPSGSVGWRVSEESFMQGMKGVINNLKVRFSAGTIGNQNIRDNAFDPIMSSSFATWLGDGSTSGRSLTYGLPRTTSDVLSWEKVTTYDAGIDISLYNMISIVADVFQRNTYGMLAPGEALPGVLGADAPLTNAGNLRTRGWEVAVSLNKVINKDLTIRASASISNAQSVVTKWQSDGTISSMYEGMVLGEIWGLTTDRLLQESDFTGGVMNSNLPDQSSLRTGVFQFQPGDVLYKDLDGDGKITNGTRTDIGRSNRDNYGDLSIIGNSLPKYEYNFRLGFDYKGFDFNAFFQGVGKRELAPTSSDVFLPFQRGYYDLLYSHQSDYWTPTNTNAYYPRLWRYSNTGTTLFAGVYGHGNSFTQTRYLLNLAYMRLKNLTVGYTLPRTLTNKVDISRLRVYFSGENLFTIQDTNVPMDPENTRSEHMLGRTFPMQRTFSVGIQVNF